MAIVKEKRLILSEIGSNHNKWYHLELHDDGRVVSRWGRIGDSGQEKALGYGESLFEAKAAEKEKKGYTEQRTLSSNGTTTATALHSTPLHKSHLQQIASRQIQTNSQEALDLIQRLVAANVHAILSRTTLCYNAASGLFSTPLGIVTQDAIDEARRTLSTIGDYVARRDYQSSSLLRATNRYLNLVPQDFGRRRRSLQELYPDLKAVQQQNDLLDRLETSLQMALTNPGQESEPQPLFQASLHLIQCRTTFGILNKKYKSTLNRSHACSKLKLRRAYSVEIASMRQAFEAKGRQINSVMELWHGTNTGNILNILKDGFRIKPPSTAAITGKMFGEGAYFALQSSKSLNYAHGYWSGTRHKNCFMFLCDVAVGRYQVPDGTTSKRPDKGFDSYWAQPGKTSGIINDEIVVFNESQINPKYLLEFTE